MARETNYISGKFTRTVDTVDFVILDFKFDENGTPLAPVATPFTWYGVNDKTFNSFIAKNFPAMTVARLRDYYQSKITIDENDLYKAMQDGNIPFKIERVEEKASTEETPETSENASEKPTKMTKHISRQG